MRKPIIVPIFFLLWLLAACSTTEQVPGTHSDVQKGAQSGEGMRQESYVLQKSIPEPDETVTTSLERKVLYSATLNLTVKNPDTANMHLSRLAERYNGYVNEVGTRKTVIRVESKFLNSAITDIARIGELESKNLQGQDVTDQYLDYHTRLDNAEKARAKYLELLEDAETVQEAVLVEKELERLNETIELLKGKINRISHLAEFSTITIYLKEKKKPGILGYAGLGIYHAVKWLFVRN